MFATVSAVVVMESAISLFQIPVHYPFTDRRTRGIQLQTPSPLFFFVLTNLLHFLFLILCVSVYSRRCNTIKSIKQEEEEGT